jgi:hypothetical protein
VEEWAAGIPATTYLAVRVGLWSGGGAEKLVRCSERTWFAMLPVEAVINTWHLL